jgi:hypothetical protein
MTSAMVNLYLSITDSLRSSLFWDVKEHRLVVGYHFWDNLSVSPSKAKQSKFFLNCFVIEDGM